jgi:hypothetical protein
MVTLKYAYIEAFVAKTVLKILELTMYIVLALYEGYSNFDDIYTSLH